MKLICLLGAFLNILSFYGQTDSSWNVLLLKEGNNIEKSTDMSSVSNHGFYLYKNCIYEITLTNKKSMSGRLIDIRPDTLYFTNFFNEAVAKKADSKLDTLKINFRGLDKLSLISDRHLDIYTKISLENYEFIFTKDTIHNFLKSEWEQIFTNDSSYYELVPHLTAQGVNLLFEENGQTYYYYGSGLIKPDRSQQDNTYDCKNFIWFTPAKVEKINGLSFGVFTENIKNDKFNEKDSLEINGLNIEINPLMLITLTMTSYSGPYPDSLEFYEENLKDKIELKINGFNLSFVGTINEAKVNGVNLAGYNTVVDHINGLTISGANNFSYRMNGLSIAGIRNHATYARGVQIALFNKSTKLKGFQIGLWNVNGKRSLPFINWQFK